MEIKVKSSKIVTSVVFLFIFFWMLMQLLAPLSLPSGSVTDLSGVVGVVDNEQSIDSLPFPWNGVYRAGDVLCHQRHERSFVLNGNQLPFCARCTAIWIGMAIGIACMIFLRIPLDGRFLLVVLLALLPLVIDGFGQLVGLWESTNVMRVVTGMLIGLVCGIALGIIVDELHDIIRLIKTKTR